MVQRTNVRPRKSSAAGKPTSVIWACKRVLRTTGVNKRITILCIYLICLIPFGRFALGCFVRRAFRPRRLGRADQHDSLPDPATATLPRSSSTVFLKRRSHFGLVFLFFPLANPKLRSNIFASSARSSKILLLQLHVPSQCSPAGRCEHDNPPSLLAQPQPLRLQPGSKRSFLSLPINQTQRRLIRPIRFGLVGCFFTFPALPSPHRCAHPPAPAGGLWVAP